MYSALGNNEKAKMYLEVAYDQVVSKADQLKDYTARESFLTNVRENREVVAAWEALNE